MYTDDSIREIVSYWDVKIDRPRPDIEIAGSPERTAHRLVLEDEGKCNSARLLAETRRVGDRHTIRMAVGLAPQARQRDDRPGGDLHLPAHRQLPGPEKPLEADDPERWLSRGSGNRDQGSGPTTPPRTRGRKKPFGDSHRSKFIDLARLSLDIGGCPRFIGSIYGLTPDPNSYLVEVL